MRILVTGSSGFIGKNLISILKYKYPTVDILTYDQENTEAQLSVYTSQCDFVIHLAGVNRPNNNDDFIKGNFNLTKKLVENLEKNSNLVPIIFSSSIQSDLSNEYGRSKKMAEDEILDYSRKNNIKSYIFKLTNVFGKWCKPNYNSVVATFCSKIANNQEITINDPKTKLNLIHVDDVVKCIIELLHKESDEIYQTAYPTYQVTLQELSEHLMGFKNINKTLLFPNLNDDFIKKLYSTYVTYMNPSDWVYELKMHVDNRGYFSEVAKISSGGQFSINLSHKNIIKGNHWHSLKHEKFIVIHGNGLIKLRDIYNDQVHEIFVNGESLKVVEIVPGMTHSIENLGEDNLITLMWVNEHFNSQEADTYYLDV